MVDTTLDDYLEEGEQETEDDLDTDQKIFSQAVIWGTDWTVETINNQLKKGNIQLNPKFQRRNAWNEEKKSKLIESLILGLPVPEIILAEVKDKKGKYIIIDGKQRLLSIRNFLASNTDDKFSRFKLRKLPVLEQLIGKSYSDFEKNNELQKFKEALDNQSIRTIIIKNWQKDSFLYTVFYRLNTGSLPLSPQELRQALHPGPFIDFAEQLSHDSKCVLKMLHLKEPDRRMRDVEIIITYFSFKNCINKYHGRFKKFLDDSVEELNNLWFERDKELESQAKELDEAIMATITIFGEKDAFSKYTKNEFQHKFNRAVFEIMSYYFSNPEIRIKALNYKIEIKNAYISLCMEDREFLASIEIATKDLDKVVKRFSAWGIELAKILEIEILIPKRVDGGVELVNIS
jgi:hypothetical protein